MKLNKAIMFLIIFIVLLNPVVALLDMCEDRREINTNCTMVTPTVIGCENYTYSIVNVTEGTFVVTDDNLTELYVNGSIYYFNFTQPEGDYLVELCDNSTREIRVLEEDESKMILGVIILLPMILGIIFLLGAWSMGEEHHVLKFFLFLLCVPMFFLSFHLGMVGLVKFYNFPELQEAMASSTYIIGIIFALLVSYVIIYFVLKLFMTFKKNKESSLEY